MTPVISPESTSISMVLPPVPVAWNTSASTLPARCSTICVTAGVVTPNMVRPTAIFVAGGSTSPPALMPTMACAAFDRITRDIRLSPARSVIDGTMTTSLTPTYGATSPEASVDTMIFGRPIGSLRMPAVMIEGPPPPPMPMIPAISLRVMMNAAKAAAIPATATPRSVPSSNPGGPKLAISAAPTSGGIAGARVPTSTTSGSPPRARMRSARKASSSPFVSAVPTT